MSDQLAHKQIVLIDRQHSWLERSTQTLRRAGFSVEPLADYDYPPHNMPHDAPPRLVVLGCASVGQAEMDLIRRILLRGDHLLVLSTSISQREMRNLFLRGAADVTDKPYDSGNLVSTVTQVLNSLSPSR
jgi:DNA-binding NtrC family response regulator